jgi:hypothetical protein
MKVCPCCGKPLTEVLAPDLMRDPDALHDDDTVFFLTIQVRRKGNMGVGGCIMAPLPFVLEMLDKAKEVVKSEHMRQAFTSGRMALSPAHDNPQLPEVLEKHPKIFT